MSMFLLCERCDERCHEWTVREAVLHIGELDRKARLCEPCTRMVQDAIRTALKSPVHVRIAERA